MTEQDQTSDGLSPPSPKKVRASYSMGCKASPIAIGIYPKPYPVYATASRGNFWLSMPGLAATTLR